MKTLRNATLVQPEIDDRGTAVFRTEEQTARQADRVRGTIVAEVPQPSAQKDVHPRHRTAVTQPTGQRIFEPRLAFAYVTDIAWLNTDGRRGAVIAAPGLLPDVRLGKIRRHGDELDALFAQRFIRRGKK